MSLLHELLAAEKTVTSDAERCIEETRTKFGKHDHHFTGRSKTVSRLSVDETSAALEEAAREEKALANTVYEDLGYTLGMWAKAEDLLLQKSLTNQIARGDIMFRGGVIAKDVPVDELLGLEKRLGTLRGLLNAMPTLDNSIAWERDPNVNAHAYKAVHPEVTLQTQKIVEYVTVAPATDKHPAQVRDVPKDVPVAKITVQKWSGAVTTVQKAAMIVACSELINEVKAARMRANTTMVAHGSIGSLITEILMAPLSA